MAEGSLPAGGRGRTRGETRSTPGLLRIVWPATAVPTTNMGLLAPIPPGRALRQPSFSRAGRAQEGRALPVSDDAGGLEINRSPIGSDAFTGTASPYDRKGLCVRALGAEVTGRW